jgi:hypothetical protein
MIRLDQLPWLLWRLARNSICAFSPTKNILFPSNKLAAQFGPSDGAYGWQVFCVHFERLRKARFSCADSILEVGPGRLNLRPDTCSRIGNANFAAGRKRSTLHTLALAVIS